METKKNTMHYIVIAILVLVALFALLYFIGMNNSVGVVGGGSANNAQDSATDVENNTNSNTNEVVIDEEIEAEREKELEEIQDKRDQLLAEQAQLEISPSDDGESTEPVTEEERLKNQERQNEIDLELLELKNQEEYPPLGNPGL